jgi:hypothetical protein
LKKSLILGLVIGASLLFAGCGDKKLEDKKAVELKSGEVSSGIVIGKELANYKLKDQFDKEHTLTNDVKKILFAFSKPTGHLMKVYLGVRPVDYLSSRDIVFIADISGMPSLIAKMFAIPDLKESKYSVLLIRKKENAKRFRNEEHKNEVMIITLDNKIVKNVKFVSNEEDLKKAID